jgi:hypothetical protein
MKILLLFLIAFSLPTLLQTQTSVKDEASPMTVSSYKWSRMRQTVENAAPVDANVPARQVIPQNKNFARNGRVNDPRGARDPNQDTLDGRSEALEKSVQESRAPKSEPRDGFAYRVKVKNASDKIVEIVFWEFQFSEAQNPDVVARRQFLCGVNIPGKKDKELEGFSLSGPSDVVSVGALADKSRFKENVLINRVEYSDGSIWQRKGWSLAEVKATYQRVLREPWVPGQCKGL